MKTHPYKKTYFEDFPLFLTVGLEEVSRLLLRNGANVNAVDPGTKDTALHFILTTTRVSDSDQRYKVAEVFVNGGANVNARNINGQTPLSVADDERSKTYSSDNNAKFFLF